MTGSVQDQSAVTLEIGPMSAAEILVLHELLGQELAGAMSSSPAEGDGRLGEPGALVVVLALSGPVIAATAAFLLKPRRRERVSYRLSATFADGTTISEEYEIERSAADTPPPAVLDRLAALTNIQPPQLSGESQE